ncbi:MAG: hypothetical protein AABX99_00975 [Nanoarchaeota archaeon]
MIGGPLKTDIERQTVIAHDLEIIDMVVFRKEIAALKAEREKNVSNMREFVYVNPDELTEADAVMWYKFKNDQKGLVLPVDFYEYEKEINVSEVSSRFALLAVFKNKLLSLWTEEESAEYLALQEKGKKLLEMEAFRSEIKKLVAVAWNQTGKDLEFRDILPSQLTETDAEMWRRVQNSENITETDLEKYRKDIKDDDRSRLLFYQVIEKKVRVFSTQEHKPQL